MDRSRREPLQVTSALVALAVAVTAIRAAPPLAVVLDAESRRIEMIERVSPSVVCVFDANLRGGGSGVIVDPEGYGLTNYHVVAGLLADRKGWGGLGDGVRYELEVLGIDVTGDVAMFRLIPPTPHFKFPYAALGDSDAVAVGDPVLAMGNPFILSEDYTPTVTLGIVTGVHRYQQGVRGNLVYTDCIQVDAAINPGNSGGPLFNDSGAVVGINGRISVNTRGRFNVGFGYAISANQIKRFIPALRAGLAAQHGTWQARVEDTPDSGAVFAEIRRSGPTYNAGVRVGDRLLTLDGVPIRSANHVASLLGTYPAHWPVVLGFARNGVRRRALLRLDPVPLNLRRPFQVDQAVNLRQVKRVLRGFRRAVFGNEQARLPTRWRWSVRRRYQPSADGEIKPPERFSAAQVGDGPVQMRQRLSDGSLGRLIEYDDQSATQRTGEEGEPFDLAPGTRLALGALYAAQCRLLAPPDTLDWTHVAHVGADAYWPSPDAEGDAQAVGRAPPVAGAVPAAAPRLLEVIEWPLPAGTRVRFAFDAASFVLVRATVRDELSGHRVTIRFRNRRSLGVLSWPCTVEVQGEGWGFRDTLTDWELSP